MNLDSDVSNADSFMMVEFYENNYDSDYPGLIFVRIMNPGDKTNIVEQPLREDHKTRFARQWLHFQSKNSGAAFIGTPLEKWNEDQPKEFNHMQMSEMHILKFQTVEQIATASDAQMQRVGMGGFGMRERARQYLSAKNRTESNSELEKTRSELDELKSQMALLMAQLPQAAKAEEPRRPGRPKKEETNAEYDAPVGDAGH